MTPPAPAKPFEHQQGSHCESSAAASLLAHHGWALSEPMCFGLSSAINFIYFPFLKLYGLPLIAYRMMPGAIIGRLRKRFKLPLRMEQFRQPQAGKVRLDGLLHQGIPVGLQTSIYWLSYIPEKLRFHFNAHNVIAFGLKPVQATSAQSQSLQAYAVSDPVLPHAESLPEADLQRARFTKGVLAPKGRLFYLEHDIAPQDVRAAIRPALILAARQMIGAPLPWIGVNGIRYLAKQLAKLPDGPASPDDARFLLHIVRMQEVIGTGGAGFRYLYAAFLQESAALLQEPKLETLANQLTLAGDGWRELAATAAKMGKGRSPIDSQALYRLTMEIAELEEVFFKELLRVGKGLGK